MCKRMEGSQKVIVKGIETPDKCSYSQEVYDMEGILDVNKPAKVHSVVKLNLNEKVIFVEWICRKVLQKERTAVERVLEQS